jgi:HlyD family secretion protein
MKTGSMVRLSGIALTFVCSISGCEKSQPVGWSGYMEGEYVYVAAPIGGTLATLAVQRGQSVSRGGPLFALESENESAAREEAMARAAAAGAQAANADKGRRSDEIAVIQAQLAQARALATLAGTELVRQQQLVAKGFISAAKLDEFRASAAQSQARVVEVEASLRVAQLPARKDERTAADAGALAAQFALKQSQWREQQKQRAAPLDARIAETYFRVGEWVNAGQPVVSLLPAEGVKARFFVAEQALSTIAIGQVVQIGCDGCGASVDARISFIATQAEYTPPIIYSNSQRARLVFMVEARPFARGSKDSTDAARLKPGQPVDVYPAPTGASATS